MITICQGVVQLAPKAKERFRADRPAKPPPGPDSCNPDARCGSAGGKNGNGRKPPELGTGIVSAGGGDDNSGRGRRFDPFVEKAKVDFALCVLSSVPARIPRIDRDAKAAIDVLEGILRRAIVCLEHHDPIGYWLQIDKLSPRRRPDQGGPPEIWLG
jgi:hypothetical protein